jgi:hypothetical protein
VKILSLNCSPVLFAILMCCAWVPELSRASTGQMSTEQDVKREPALWTQPSATANELLQTKFTCVNADKLAGVHSGVLSAYVNFGFSGSNPSELSANFDMRNRAPISKNVTCTSGRLRGRAESFVLNCASDAQDAEWVFTLRQDESIYAKRSSLAFFKGSVKIPLSVFVEGAAGADSIAVNCLARSDGNHSATDDHYLKELRHMFGHVEELDE